jgi:hypothetical protein
MTEQFRYSENEAAVVLGFTRDQLKLARSSLAEGEDWGLNGHQVAYTDRGLEKVIAALGVNLLKRRSSANPGAITLANVKKRARINTAAPSPTMAAVWRPKGQTLVVAIDPRRVSHKGLLVCRFKDGPDAPKSPRFMSKDGTVGVRVTSTQHFKVGMEVQCAHVRDDLWDFTGRMPRPSNRRRY